MDENPANDMMVMEGKKENRGRKSKKKGKLRAIRTARNGIRRERW